MSFTEQLQYVIQTARGAGQIVAEHYGKVARLTKRQAEAVTDADRASQRFIVSELKKRFPSDGFVGEENETGDAITFESVDPRGRVWVIDPIDGTNNFVAGLGNFAVCIGLLEAGQPTLGVVFDVTRNQVYCAARGHGAWLDDRPIHVLTTALGEASLLMLTSNLTIGGDCPAWASRWIAQNDWKVRILGSAALECVTVAAGVAHGAVTINGKLWDVVAPAAILLEAGGKITDLAGKPIFPFDLKGYDGAKVPFLAAGAAAHPVLLDELSR
jgi:fructose-1,6-bisphosphatase/inositol monophosphatase family enzyme